MMMLMKTRRQPQPSRARECPRHRTGGSAFGFDGGEGITYITFY